MKSTVPATLVLRPSVPNRVISRIPDSPPVTTTIGRPALSRMLPMYSPDSLQLACFTGQGPLQQAPLCQAPRPPVRTTATRSRVGLQDALRLSCRMINLASGVLQYCPL